MTLRSRILLLSLLVFGALALVGSSVRYLLKRQAVLYGLHEQAETYALALATYASESDWNRQPLSEAARRAYTGALDQLARWNTLRGVAIWQRQGRRLLYRWGATLPPPPIRRFTPTVRAVATDVLRGGGTEAVVVAYTPLTNTTPEGGDVLGVMVDASFFPAEMAALMRASIRGAVCVVAAGLCVSFLFASWLSFELRRLTRAAGAGRNGRLAAPPPGIIAEVTEVGETFMVVDNVIDEIRSKAHRALLDDKRFRSEADLVRFYREKFFPPLLVERAGLRVALGATGASPAVFRESAANEGTGWLCFGCIDGPASLETAVAAAAAGSEMADRLECGEAPAEALTAAAERFPLRCASVLTWQKGGPILCHRYASDRIATTTLAWPGGGHGLVCSEFATAAPETLGVYLRRSLDEPPEQGLKALGQLAGEAVGVIAVLQAVV